MEDPAAEVWLQGFIDDRMADRSYVQQQDLLLAFKEKGYQSLMQRMDEEEKPVVVRRLWKWGWAAAIVFLLGASFYFWSENKPQSTVASKENKIEPGKKGAILTLANGEEVVLDTLGNGLITTQNGAKVLLQNGQLAYDPTGNGNMEIVYNTIKTPNGREFQVRLPDGTIVWLNAASSLRYPTLFTGKERKVEITGEAYFEVATDADMPFRVNVNNKVNIEVLGTHFNVNAYDNEHSLNTTLLEGAVRVQSVVLKPGQQAQVAEGETVKVVNNVNLETVMAWKNGLFNFENKSLEEVMRQLERWYDLEVVYEKGIPDIKFGGEMSRDMDLAGLLKSLEASKVHFRLEEGRKLIVLP
ncbi:DUF4974 domain-containing protein [Chitinophaga sp. SYP-B3965]|nr:DUF4974 domain-containing protein [Chitinophaga sp. SYP-B3965]